MYRSIVIFIMTLKLTKCLNEANQYTLVSYDINDELYSEKSDLFENNIYVTDENYYYYIKDIDPLDNYQNFKIKAKRGDIVMLIARDNNCIAFPSKRTFSIAFNFDYNGVLKYKWKTVLLDGKPYEVKYIKDKENKKINEVIYTLAKLVEYVSIIIKGYNYNKMIHRDYPDTDDPIKKVITKYYSKNRCETDRKYELNIKQVYQTNDGKWHKIIKRNISTSNKYLYDYWLLKMFIYMILSKSINDRKTDKDPIYCFHETFDTIEEVYDFLENNQDIVNNFFIESDSLFNKPNSIYIASPHINGIYMYTEYLGVKYTLYRSIDERYFNDKTLKQTYVSTRYKLRIKGIKTDWNLLYENINNMI